MGGTFDPIHHGHLVAASEVQAWFNLDEVVFVPTGDPWQKSDRNVSPAEHRYLMTAIATASNPRFTVSRVDIDRRGPTYSIDTLIELQAAMPTADLYFITGADALTQILTWRDALELFDLAHFVGCSRPGFSMDPAILRELPAHRVTLVEIPGLNISSSDCRDRVRRGAPINYLVPDGVAQYIAKHRLYLYPALPSVRMSAPRVAPGRGAHRAPRHAAAPVEEFWLEGALEAEPLGSDPLIAAPVPAPPTPPRAEEAPSPAPESPTVLSPATAEPVEDVSSDDASPAVDAVAGDEAPVDEVHLSASVAQDRR